MAWVAIVVFVGYMGFLGVSDRYKSPFNVGRATGGQTGYISNALIDSDATLHAIFARGPS